MTNLYINFTLVDKFGRKTHFKEPIHKAKEVAIELMERLVNKDSDTLYIWDEENKYWKELDYFNDL
jgi:hypothetical protein